MESNSVCNSEYDLQTELDDTKSYFQLITSLTISETKLKFQNYTLLFAIVIVSNDMIVFFSLPF